MKIRIKGNAVRYRLTRSDMEKLEKKGTVEEVVNFGNANLFYALQVTEAEQMSASFVNNYITIYFPAAWINNWVNTDAVGFTQTIVLNDSAPDLQLAVEKDFTCLDKVSEDQSDHYPNPLMKEVYE